MNLLWITLAPDPQYGFEKKLDKKKHGKTKRKLKLKCKTDNPETKVKWYKNGKEIKLSDTKFLIKNEAGEQTLEIKEAELEDSGTYTCKIEEFGKEGESETSCEVVIGGRFLSKSFEFKTRDGFHFSIQNSLTSSQVNWNRKNVLKMIRLYSPLIVSMMMLRLNGWRMAYQSFQTAKGNSKGNLQGTMLEPWFLPILTPFYADLTNPVKETLHLKTCLNL